MDLLAITAQLSVLNGEVQEQRFVPGLLAQPAPGKSARGREHDFLFAHLTLTGLPGETTDLAQELIQNLSQRFYTAAGSVTSTLRRAVIATNEELLRLNLTLKTPHEGALTCAVLHGSELYTLQVGEGIAFLGHNFGVERLPVKPPSHLTPMGRTAGIDIRFAYHQLQSGDMMLLADPRLGYLSGAALAPVLVDTEIETGLDALMSLVARDSARLLLVEFADELPSTLPVTFAHSRQPAASFPTTTSRPAAPVTAAVAAAGAVAEPVLMPVGPKEGTGRIQAPMPADTATGVGLGARRVASSSARGLSRATGWLAALLAQFGLGRGEEQASVNWALPAMLSIALPVLIASILTGVYIQRDSVETASGIKQAMMQELILADEQADAPDAARQHYGQVIALAATAEAIRPRDLEVARLRVEALDALDRLDNIARLSATSLYDYDEGTRLGAVTLRGEEGGVVVLDESGNRVLLHPTDSTYTEPTTDGPSVLGYSGQAVGPYVMGPFVDTYWLPDGAAATRDAVAMLDRSGVLFLYYPNMGDVRAVQLGDSSSWSNPVALSTYSGRLYVLDPGASSIWKYYPQDSGFVAHADDLVVALDPQADLGQAVDFDLYSEDGSLIVIYRDGRVRYYDTRSGRVQWDENTLLQNGLSSPFTAPSAVELAGRGLNASIFVLDPGSGRIVQLSRGGTVLAQYRALDALGNDVLSRATDFAVTESPLRILVTADEQIYVAER